LICKLAAIHSKAGRRALEQMPRNEWIRSETARFMTACDMKQILIAGVPQFAPLRGYEFHVLELGVKAKITKRKRSSFYQHGKKKKPE